MLHTAEGALTCSSSSAAATAAFMFAPKQQRDKDGNNVDMTA